LIAREGRCLLPDAIIPGHEREMTADHRAWQTITLCLDLLGAKPAGLSVCGSCTLVFAPSRKRRARYCPLCAKRPAPPVLGTPEHPWPALPGESAQVRVPVWEGQQRSAWRVRTIKLADDAPAQPDRVKVEQVLIGRRDKQGAPTDRKRRARGR
ncbi:MAG TPA: hypothetical protein VKG38_07970, partial [Solirubrobacteraceae bacterium]|nr:hypothetical protein [Solirubrobacteraceae bacterium]